MSQSFEQLNNLSARARALSLELFRFQRQEEAQGHVSPLDAAFLGRLRVFLEQDVGQGLEDLTKTLVG